LSITNATGAITAAQDAAFEMRDIIVDEPPDDEILVSVVATGICHTDLSVQCTKGAQDLRRVSEPQRWRVLRRSVGFAAAIAAPGRSGRRDAVLHRPHCRPIGGTETPPHVLSRANWLTPR
jgi:hypothetical protein